MANDIPLVSVIVPVYCVEKYLQQCIDSIIIQTYFQLEIILVDDGSPDNCGNICDKNAALDARIKVIHKENGGLSSARNAGLDAARGDYIAFVDADDTVHPMFIEILLELCRQHNCDIAQCDFLAVAEDSIKLPLNPGQRIDIFDHRQALHEQCCGNNKVKYSVAWNKIYKRKLFNEIRYPNGRIHEDEFTTYLLIWKAERIVITNQYLYYYLQREASITRGKFTLKNLDVLDALRDRSAFLKMHGMEKEYISTLYSLLYSIKKNCRLLELHVKDSQEIRNRLLKEKEKIEKALPAVSQKEIDFNMINVQVSKDCLGLIESKLVLYGAGNWGRKYYQWMKSNYPGMIAGWVDNAWYGMDYGEFSVEPLDLLLRLIYDYVLITIKSKAAQEEITHNLISWGVPEDKILTISA